MPSEIVVVVISVLFAATTKSDDSIIQKFGNGAVRARLLGSIIGIIAKAKTPVGLVGFGMRKQKNALKHQCLNAVVER